MNVKKINGKDLNECMLHDHNLGGGVTEKQFFASIKVSCYIQSLERIKSQISNVKFSTP